MTHTHHTHIHTHTYKQTHTLNTNPHTHTHSHTNTHTHIHTKNTHTHIHTKNTHTQKTHTQKTHTQTQAHNRIKRLSSTEITAWYIYDFHHDHHDHQDHHDHVSPTAADLSLTFKTSIESLPKLRYSPPGGLTPLLNSSNSFSISNALMVCEANLIFGSIRCGDIEYLKATSDHSSGEGTHSNHHAFRLNFSTNSFISFFLSVAPSIDSISSFSL
eukprot:GHVQ01027263.1.p2 GENE.GHVQ01027263.1~~GHVQ01027263.1.p2  ORF type:complete len:233 (+),score=40.03 GHVQ01027263.1:55-699(+)